MAVHLEQQTALALWREALGETVRRDGPDLSARQMAILLNVYTTEAPHIVRGMAKDLAISKPAVSRALDRLSQLGFIRRQRDEADKRNVLIRRTVKGAVFLSEFAEIVSSAGEELEDVA